ncbi:ATP-binding cassette sub-family A member 1 [Caerostris darwini]|uniref:ATP-binding cassette sub-family A member 1 n=2 Tax=Caerostris darwini TaxID=1538125 RepID=A0AAV4SVE4_9ARAC|nr:ATP-binding cassette sub-family A member 1 [Caerostris darwini]
MDKSPPNQVQPQLSGPSTSSSTPQENLTAQILQSLVKEISALRHELEYFICSSEMFNKKKLLSIERKLSPLLCAKTKLGNSIRKLLSSYLNTSVEIRQFEGKKSLKENFLSQSHKNATHCDAGVEFLTLLNSYKILAPEGDYSSDNCPFSTTGFISNIQQSVDVATLQLSTGDSNLDIPPTTITADFGDEARDNAMRIVKWMSLMLFIPIILAVIQSVTLENKSKIKEGMPVMGVKPTAYWSAFLIFEVVIIFISIIFPTLFLSIYLQFSPSVNKGAILYFFLSFGFGCSIVICTLFITRLLEQLLVVSMSIFSMFLSTFAFDNLSQQNPEDIKYQEYLLLLNPPIAYERGLHWIFLDGIDLTWKKSYESTDDNQKHEIEANTSKNEPCIKLKNIIKIYSSVRHPVLYEVSLTIYTGEVTCLLGANGAGKTTLMKIISNAVSQDTGSIFMKPSLKMGVCPQENILHKNFDVTDHLLLYGRLKGLPEQQLNQKVGEKIRFCKISVSS